MFFSSVIIIWCLSFGILVTSTSALRCYSCEWDWEEQEGARECLHEPPPPRFLKECSQPQCWKRLTANENGTITMVQRFCVAVVREQLICRGSDNADPITGDIISTSMECVCDTDGCNGSSTDLNCLVNPSLIGLVVIITKLYCIWQEHI